MMAWQSSLRGGLVAVALAALSMSLGATDARAQGGVDGVVPPPIFEEQPIGIAPPPQGELFEDR